jgi:hypothetical protein
VVEADRAVPDVRRSAGSSSARNWDARREAAGVTQQEPGGRVFRSGSYTGRFEAAIRKPRPEPARRFDEELDTDGCFARMREELISSSPFADCFTEAAEFQVLAAAISVCSPALVPGLLRTEGYARGLPRGPAVPRGRGERGGGPEQAGTGGREHGSRRAQQPRSCG